MMLKLFGWSAYLSVPAALVIALITREPQWFTGGLISTLAFAAIAIMLIEPND